MTAIPTDQVIAELLNSVIMSVNDPDRSQANRLRQWSAQQKDPAEFRMLLLEGAVELFADTLTQAIGRAEALEILNVYRGRVEALILERQLLGQDVVRDGWSLA
ncbi:hypothetical protein [Leifsonia aquatica]|uniref:hypothetical protein n=1 Tax=Leifsonia aquatica TaxID=144185 RepID=UPI00046917F8|nr:hypothetical protein [Leifsonia aquatica]